MPTHRVSVVTKGLTSSAWCACGWHGPAHGEPLHAARDARQHQQAPPQVIYAAYGPTEGQAG